MLLSLEELFLYSSTVPLHFPQHRDRRFHSRTAVDAVIPKHSQSQQPPSSPSPNPRYPQSPHPQNRRHLKCSRQSLQLPPSPQSLAVLFRLHIPPRSATAYPLPLL